MNRHLTILNLTNGIEYLNSENKIDGFTRIQSSQCENKAWEDVLNGFDSNWLMFLALGYKIDVVDYSNHADGNARAMWQGGLWLTYAISMAWFKHEPIEWQGTRGWDVMYWRNVYANLSRKTLRRLKYYRKFLQTDKVNLKFISLPTKMDGKNEFYTKIIRNWNNENL